jgi:hypothetical protein
MEWEVGRYGWMEYSGGRVRSRRQKRTAYSVSPRRVFPNAGGGDSGESASGPHPERLKCFENPKEIHNRVLRQYKLPGADSVEQGLV